MDVPEFRLQMGRVATTSEPHRYIIRRVNLTLMNGGGDGVGIGEGMGRRVRMESVARRALVHVK